jgi:hypothetical protein
MKHRISLLVAVLCIATATAFAQAGGPYTNAPTGSDPYGGHYPATNCLNFTGYTCIITEVCSPFAAGGRCSGPGPEGLQQDTGGIGRWIIYVHHDTSPTYTVTTNSSGASQGYIVTIGSPGQYWYFQPNTNTSQYRWCTFSPPNTGVLTNTVFDGSHSYYRSYQICN